MVLVASRKRAESVLFYIADILKISQLPSVAQKVPVVEVFRVWRGRQPYILGYAERRTTEVVRLKSEGKIVL